MGRTSLLRRKQAEHAIDRHPVRRREIHRAFQTKERSDWPGNIIKPRMGNGNPAPKPCAAQCFTLFDPFKHDRSVKSIDLAEAISEGPKNLGFGFGPHDAHRLKINRK